MHSTSQPEAFTPEGLQLQDGGQIPADVIVFATGFDGNMRNAVGNFVESEVYEKLSEFWGVDEEGELLGAFKFTGCACSLNSIFPGPDLDVFPPPFLLVAKGLT